MSFKVTTSLPTLLRTKPANFNGYLTKFDAVARHPSVWPFFLGSIFGAAFVTYPSVAVGGTSSSIYYNTNLSNYYTQCILFHIPIPLPHTFLLLSRILLSIAIPPLQRRASRNLPTSTALSRWRSTRPRRATTPTKCTVTARIDYYIASIAPIAAFVPPPPPFAFLQATEPCHPQWLVDYSGEGKAREGQGTTRDVPLETI